MATQSLTDEIKNRSGWSIFMGVLTALLGVFLIVYPMAAATVTTLLDRLGVDFRRHRPDCFCA